VLDPREPDDHALAEFNSRVVTDPRVGAVMLPIRDGVTMACRL
jgi:caffeoyl-CoA O-methyltransferase